MGSESDSDAQCHMCKRVGEMIGMNLNKGSMYSIDADLFRRRGAVIIKNLQQKRGISRTITGLSQSSQE